MIFKISSIPDNKPSCNLCIVFFIKSTVEEEVSLEVPENVKNHPSLSLSLVKLIRSGLLLFTFPSNNFHQVVGILSNILVALGSGNLKHPL